MQKFHNLSSAAYGRVFYKKLILFFSIVFLPLASIAQPASPAAVVNKLAPVFIANKNIPGMAIAVYYHNKPYFYNYGVANTNNQQPITSDTIFEIASLTKVFTAILLAEQVQAGKMSLQDSVVKYLPDYVKNRGGAINEVTLLELATHTSSLPRIPPGVTIEDRSHYSKADLLNFVAQWQPDRTIGTHYAYSNLGFGLLGYALEAATSESYQQLLQENIFNPLHMQSSSLVSPITLNLYARGYSEVNEPVGHWPKNAWPAADGIRSTAKDMMQFLAANLGDPSSGVSPQLIQAMHYTQQSFFETRRFKQGLAWEILPDGMIKKDGSTRGFSTFILLWPAKQMGIVILSNKIHDKDGKLAEHILKQLAGSNALF